MGYTYLKYNVFWAKSAAMFKIEEKSGFVLKLSYFIWRIVCLFILITAFLLECVTFFVAKDGDFSTFCLGVIHLGK